MLNKLDYSTARQNKLIVSFVSSTILVSLLCTIYLLHRAESKLTYKTNEVIVSADTTIVIPEPIDPIYFTGDIMLGRHVERLLQQDAITPSHFTASFASSSAVVINFESAMASPHIPVASGEMRFSVATSSLVILNELNVTHASLANNHSRDYGREGHINAISELKKVGVEGFGDAVSVSTSSVSYITVGTTTLSILGIHTLFGEPDDSTLGQVFQYMENTSDIQLVYIHWGEEYALMHNIGQANFARRLIARGADAVIGHHPHVTQDIDVIDGVPIFYSLGNFIFDQYFSRDVKEGYVLSLNITSEALTFQIIPHHQCQKSTPCPMVSDDKTAFLSALAKRSNETLRDGISAGEISFLR